MASFSLDSKYSKANRSNKPVAASELHNSLVDGDSVNMKTNKIKIAAII
jgi:hypothetical protein